MHLRADLDELIHDVLASPRLRHARPKSVPLDPAQDRRLQPVGREAMRHCTFGAYMQPELRPADRVYTEVTDPQALLSTLEAYMAEHDGAALLYVLLSVMLLLLSVLVPCGFERNGWDKGATQKQL